MDNPQPQHDISRVVAVCFGDEQQNKWRQHDIFEDIINNYTTGVITAATAPVPLLPPLREQARPK